jgi:hypothetical protein
MNTDAAAKIAMLKGSMRCYIFGLLGFLPIVGLPFAFLALWFSGLVRKRERQYWNAAKPYRICGVVCAASGTVIWFIVFALLIYNSASNPGNDDQWNGGD